jgi:hypothetical protein
VSNSTIHESSTVDLSMNILPEMLRDLLPLEASIRSKIILEWMVRWSRNMFKNIFGYV